MALIARLSRLIKADVHAVIDELEDPLAVLKQSLREMEEAILQLRQRSQQLADDEARMLKHSKEAQASATTWEEELALCLEKDNDDLAKTIIRRQLTAKKIQEEVRTRLADLREEKEAIATKLKEQENLFESLKQESELFNQQKCESNVLIDNHGITQDDVEIALLKAKAARS